MKDSFRQSMAWLHTWVGLVAGWVLFFVFVTGTAGYFQREITRWMQPERVLTVAPAQVERVALTETAMKRLSEVAPVAASWRITFPYRIPGDRDWQTFSIRWEEMPTEGHDYGASSSERLNPLNGKVVPPDPEPRETAGGGGL
ncbi:MAG: PepSY domain-containing protein [Novosphingobium sp.]